MESPTGQIITFYSYKGGTGRSMALANIAYILATEPSDAQKPVLMIDWDLEAPGLHQFFHWKFTNHFGQQKNYALALDKAPGLIDFLTNISKFYQDNTNSKWPERLAGEKLAKDLFEEAIDKYPLKNYSLQVDGNFSLSIMKAGAQHSEPSNEPSYMKKVQDLDWGAFYRNYGSFFTHFRAYLMQKYEYVLIDSRTGLTDTSGICTRVMPEKLVAVFVPNQQNLEGIQRVVRQALEYRLASRDERPLEIFPLASRIDGSDSTRRRIWWQGGEIDGKYIKGYQKTFEELFKQLYSLDDCGLYNYFDATQIPHDSVYAYGEKVAAEKDGIKDKLSIGHACAELTSLLTKSIAPWELQELSSQEFRPLYDQITSDQDFQPLYDKIVSEAQNWIQSGRPWYKLLDSKILTALGYAKSVEQDLEKDVAIAQFLTESRKFDARQTELASRWGLGCLVVIAILILIVLTRMLSLW